MNGLARLLAPGVLAAHPALSIFVGARLSIASMGGLRGRVGRWGVWVTEG